jgi:hypothetical protein
VVAITFRIFWIVERTFRFDRLAKYHCSKMLRVGLGFIDSETGRPISIADVRRHEMLYHKYLKAARYPWLAIEPDPPEPE